MSSYINLMNNFEISNLPDLDTVVLAALELFELQKVPKIDLSAYKHPLVVGSGNAEATGRIIFESSDAIFASESNFEEKLKNIKSIDGVYLISASGGKHAPVIASKSLAHGKKVTLITNTRGSDAEKIIGANNVLFYPKNREPYTYNTSTYMGMILGATNESPNSIKQFIETTVAKMDLPNFSNYDKYYLIVPARFSGIIRMLQVKFIELFGRNIARDIETDEYVAHATTVAPSNELFISFGTENTTWGKPENRLFVPLPDNAGYASMMAVGYYVVSQIQKAYPHYFKDNISSYTDEVSKIFGSEIKPIVENK